MPNPINKGRENVIAHEKLSIRQKTVGIRMPSNWMQKLDLTSCRNYTVGPRASNSTEPRFFGSTAHLCHIWAKLPDPNCAECCAQKSSLNIPSFLTAVTPVAKHKFLMTNKIWKKQQEILLAKKQLEIDDLRTKLQISEKTLADFKKKPQFFEPKYNGDELMVKMSKYGNRSTRYVHIPYSRIPFSETEKETRNARAMKARKLLTLLAGDESDFEVSNLIAYLLVKDPELSISVRRRGIPGIGHRLTPEQDLKMVNAIGISLNKRRKLVSELHRLGMNPFASSSSLQKLITENKQLENFEHNGYYNEDELDREAKSAVESIIRPVHDVLPLDSVHLNIVD